MTGSALFGLSACTLGIALTSAYVFVLGVSLYRYLGGAQSRQRLYLTLWSGSFWLAFGTLQISTCVSGTAERGIQFLAVGLFVSGIALGARWWRLRAE
jgi:hypothetical protein